MSIRDRRQRELDARRQLIVATARDLAEAEGWDAVTTRRLSERIEYSQPVLYSHFSGKTAIVGAVALEGFTELAEVLADAARSASTDEARIDAVTAAYLRFGEGNPALYEAMFTLATDLPFGKPEAPEPLKAGFAELRQAFAPAAGGRDLDAFTEVVWCALHGLIMLRHHGRLRPDLEAQRLPLLAGLIKGG
jgi:AcrR family transcriptional regulator